MVCCDRGHRGGLGGAQGVDGKHGESQDCNGEREPGDDAAQVSDLKVEGQALFALLDIG